MKFFAVWYKEKVCKVFFPPWLTNFVQFEGSWTHGGFFDCDWHAGLAQTANHQSQSIFLTKQGPYFGCLTKWTPLQKSSQSLSQMINYFPEKELFTQTAENSCSFPCRTSTHFKESEHIAMWFLFPMTHAQSLLCKLVLWHSLRNVLKWVKLVSQWCAYHPFCCLI